MSNHFEVSFLLTEHDGNVHLSDPHREHDTDTLDCWCKPDLYRVCVECDGGCWQCEGGKHELTREAAEWCNDPILVVHRL